MATLDSITGQLPKDGPLIIVTASFEGNYDFLFERIFLLI